MPLKSDPYAVLGVSQDADADTIKAAYRKLVMLYHPDHNPDDKQAEEKFSTVQEAYDIVGNADERAAYDRIRLHSSPTYKAAQEARARAETFYTIMEEMMEQEQLRSPKNAFHSSTDLYAQEDMRSTVRYVLLIGVPLLLLYCMLAHVTQSFPSPFDTTKCTDVRTGAALQSGCSKENSGSSKEEIKLPEK